MLVRQLRSLSRMPAMPEQQRLEATRPAPRHARLLPDKTKACMECSAYNSHFVFV